MITSKNNDIGNLIEQFRQRDTQQKERKTVLLRIEELLQNAKSLDNLNVKWMFLLDNVCWPIITKHDRSDFKSLAGKIIRHVGTLLFDSETYPEFLIWMGTLYQSATKKSEDTRSDIVYSVYFIVGAISQKSENRLSKNDSENVLKSLEWMIKVLPNSSISVYNHCLKGIVLVSNTFPDATNSLFESILRAILSNLPDFSSHEKNFELLIDTISLFSDKFAESPEFAEEMIRVVRPDIKKNGLGKIKELKKQLKLTMTIVKMTKSQKMLEESNQMISELSSELEENNGKWSSASLITIVCDIFNELLILGKEDAVLRNSVEESLCHVLKDLNLSKQSTKEKQAFFNSLAKFIQIVKQLPAESQIKTRVHHIVFNKDTGLFATGTRDNRIFSHNTIYKDLINLISVLLTPTSLNHLQATYTDLRRIMMESMSRLRKSSEKPNSDSVRWHESVLLLFFSALKDISTAKSSLIVMMGIRPSIFEFFTGELPLAEFWLASNHPEVYHMFVSILVKHLQAHDFYIAQSDYLVSGNNVIGQTIGQTKREYARKQVVALHKIISTFGKQLRKDTKFLISSWLHSLVVTACDQKIGPESFSQREWVRLRSIVYQHGKLGWNNESIRQAFATLSNVTDWPELSSEIDREITEKTKKAKWKEAISIWEAGDCKTYIRQSMSTVYRMQQERHQKLIAPTSFGAEEFTLVTNFLLKQIVPNTFKKGSYTWMDEVLETITQGCRSLSQDNSTLPIPDTFIEKWDWIINQTASFCIVNKMKTPIGKPMQTFQAFENEIKRLANEVLSRKNLNKKPKTVEENSVAPLKYSIQWLRVHLLLKLIEVLEKLMLSAIYGGSSLFTLTELPVSARQFFTMNSASCEVWLNRVYYPAIVVAFFSGYYGLVIRFGSNALTHYARQRSSDEKLVAAGVSAACLMSLSMAVLGEPMEIIGLRRRVREEFGTEMGQSLMEALVEMANARYEIALVALETILVSDSTLNETLKLIINIAMTDMLNRIRLPQAVDYYKKTLYGDDPDASVSEDFRSVEMLTKFEKINSSINEKRQVVDWSARERIQLVESAFSQTMRRNELLELQKEFSAMGSLALSVDTSCKLYSDISSTSIVIANLVDKMTGVSQMKNQLTDVELFNRTEEGNEGDKLAICRKIMHWGRHIKHHRGQSSAAHGEIIRLSRKTSNCQLAFFHINSAIRGDKLNVWQRLEVERQRLKLAKSQNLDVRIREMNEVFGSLADVFTTSVQLKSNFQMLQDGPVKQKMLSEGYITEIAKREEHISRASIQLADFFESLPGLDNVLAPNLFPTMIWSEIQRRSDDLSCGYPGIVGALFHLASDMCPSLAKAHLRMAKWAYEMAKIQNAPNIQLFAACSLGQNQAENDELWNCLESTCLVNFEKQVRKAIPDDRANMLLSPNSHFFGIWESTCMHRRKFMSIAVASYFQFIQNMSGEFDNLPYSKKEETTLATLRILELLVKHGDVLVDVINDGLRTTNVHVWKEILPQLFSRLSHPSEHIRKTLVDLISRICSAAPHAVVFQVVSGAASFTEEVGEDLEEHMNDDRNRVRACCEQLETKMAQSYPSLVRDVRLFVAELERINLLNEEKWSVVLGTMEHEMEKRLALIRTENSKTEMALHLMPSMKDDIIRQKTILLTRQIFDVLDDLYQQTIIEPPKTKNEEEFVLAFSELLTNAHQESKQSRLVSPEKSWAPFKNLIANFVHRNIKKGMQLFETEDISPYLANLASSCVPMPGQESVEFDRVVSIARVAKQVTILPTKTRPKKLGFVGSDGKQLAFLFKGREDLHLDERVMQFLRLCNVMLQPGKGKIRQIAEYQAHHYAVIPLGPRSGLIKWVEGATPMFHIYRKWQMKERALKQAAKEWRNKAFTAHNIDAATASDRTKWPSFIVEQVFEGLCAKTPTDLISRELWMRSNDATTWWAVTKRYARSLAVMSMVGSVLGLGDRHLDNLLVDLKWGHVVHIDYNICFDKGKYLRIPETVPFRLSRNMRHALGPSEVYGTFRESCVHVLSTLRSGDQVLTMLLDAFVFDPLVDWTSHEHTSTSGVSLALQLAVYGSNWKSKARERLTDTVELFKLRVTEMQSLWKNNRDDLLHWMKQVTDCLVIEKNIMGVNGMYAQQRVKAGTELREAVTRHQALTKDLRPLIRAIGKEREEFSNYLKFYKLEFIEPLLKGHSALRHDSDIDTCVHNFRIVMRNIDTVFGDLLNLSFIPVESITSRAPQQQFKPPPGLENVWVVKQDQQENSQAREVVRRVERRLNGWLDGSAAPDRKLSPREEADVLIAEATSTKNLAQMYEGWTAWV
uniref:Serine/threonine-protein kinase smg-1 n=1 Tax=Caenorhabditis tropicalis TaxID=1561998 RepID=A0A1I7T9F9_9PELO